MTTWNYTNLGDLCSLITDGKHGDCRNEENSGYYFISCKDIKDGQINYENARQIVHNDFAETHRRTNLKPGDVLLTNSGTIGRLAIAPNDDKTSQTTFQKSVAILKPIPNKISPKFLYYTLATNQTRLINTAGGAAQKNLLLGELRRFPIQIPPLTIQHQIVSTLSPYDELIENNRRRIQLLEESARLLYKEWFVQLRFPGHEHVKIIDGVPEGWEKKNLCQIADITMGQSPKSQYYNEEANGLPFHQGVSNFGFRFPTNQTYCSMINRLAEPGDILFSVRAPVGRINITTDQIIIGRGLAAIRSTLNQQNLLFYSLKSYFFKEDMIGGGAIFAAITKKDLYNVKLLQPPTLIADMFMAVVIPIDTQIEALHKSSKKLTEARDLLLPRLMNEEVAI